MVNHQGGWEAETTVEYFKRYCVYIAEKFVRHCLAKVVPQIEMNFRFVACFY